ncbi:MAG: hypothetical protein AAFY88_23890 [Acidobacteriota bacterium]
MKPILRSALFCLAFALLFPLAAFAADGTSADAAPAAVSQDEVALSTPADLTEDQLPWPAVPDWTKDEVTTSFGSCPGPPVLSCQCGIGLGEPGSDACCYCNTCWNGYILALCGLDP